MSKIYWLGLAVGLGCSAADTTELVSSEEAPPTAEFLAFQAYIADTLGPPSVGLDQGLSWSGELGEPAAFDRPPSDGEVEKTFHDVGHGFSMRGTSRLQDGEPQDECAISGVACDKKFHYQVVDRSVSSHADFEEDVLGRCGSELTTWLHPCILPRATKTAGGKSYKYKVDLSGCPNGPSDQPGRSYVQQGAERAVARIGSGSGFTFTATTGNDWNILIECRSAAGLPAGTMATGSPFGDLTLAYASQLSAQEDCDGLAGYRYQNENTIYQTQDMIYTYTKMRVGIVWANLFQQEVACGTRTDEQAKTFLRNIIMHELGHGFGFIHADLVGSGGWENIMYPTTDCGSALDSAQNFTTPMFWALQDIDLPRNNLPLQIGDGELSCVYPRE